MKTKIRAVLCVVLCFSLLMPAVMTASAEADPSLSVFVMSDCHYRPHSMLGPIGEQTGLPGDTLYWYTSSNGQMTYESDAIMNELLERFEASSGQILLVAGDLTDDGYLPEHLGISEKFKHFEEKTGKRIYVVNGNHNIRGADSDKSIDLAEFKSIYSDFGYSEALAIHDDSASYTVDLDGNYRLIAIDAVVAGTDVSAIDEDLLSWIKTQAAQAKADGKHLVGMIHYSILEHFKNQSLAEKYIMIEDYRDISTLFADLGIKYVFTGHVHGNDISGATSEKGNTIYDIETCSLISYPNTFRKVTFSEDSVKVESVNIDRIDAADLVNGYTDAQLELIQNDFQAFSYGFFKTGMNCFVNKYFGSPDAIGSALHIEKNTAAYDALSTVMSTLGDALTLQIYDREGTPEIDSVQEIAASVGENTEESTYKNLADIIGTVLAAHYSGVENIPYDSLEVRLFGQCFEAALIYSLAGIPIHTAGVLFEELGIPIPDSIINNLDNMPTVKLNYCKAMADRIFSVIIEPVLQGMTSDSYAPADLNVTLDGYGKATDLTQNGVLISNSKYFFDFIIRIFNVLRKLLQVQFNRC